MATAAIPFPVGWRRPSVIPGFGLALGVTVTWLSLIVLVPLAGLFLRAGTLGPAGLWHVATEAPRAGSAEAQLRCGTDRFRRSIW